MPRIPGISSEQAVRALEKVGYRVIRQGKHIVMSDGVAQFDRTPTQSHQRFHNGRDRPRCWPDSRGIPEASLKCREEPAIATILQEVPAMSDRSRQTSLPGFEPEAEEGPQSAQAEGAASKSGRPINEINEAPPLPLVQSPSPPPESLAGNTVWVIDAHSLIHQVFHAMPDMAGPHGQPIGAVFGFTRDLLYLLEEKKPDFLFCAFDLPGKTFRHAIYDQYKAQRPPMHEDLVPQIPAIHRVIRVLGIPALGCESFEADDVLATVARVTDELGGQCFIVTGRQGLPATDHRPREDLQHPQERALRPRRAEGRLGHHAEAGRRFPGPGGRFGRQRARRAADRPETGPAVARTIRHARGRARQPRPRSPAPSGRRTCASTGSRRS